MACRPGCVARRGGRDHRPRPAWAARARTARDLRDAGARSCGWTLPRQRPVVALAACRGCAVDCRLAGGGPRPGCCGSRADRRRLSRRRVRRSGRRARVVDPNRARRPRGARRRPRLGDARRARGDERAPGRGPPPRRRHSAAEPPAGDLRLGRHGVARPACACAARRRLGGPAQARRRRGHRCGRRSLGSVALRHVGGRRDGARSRGTSVRRCRCASRSSPTSTRTCTR